MNGAKGTGRKRNQTAAADDPVARIVAQWKAELPDLPVTGMEILGRARRIVLTSRPAIEAVFRDHGLDAGEFDVLAALRRSGPPYSLRPTEIFQSLMVSSGGLTDRLSRLEAKGLIRREAAPDDARSLMAVLTVKGRALAEKVMREDMAVEEALLADLAPDERRQLAALLSRLLVTLAAD
ncbi:MAG: MarR family winged helix-turn-helix transcriptional regulator [Hyphomonas sp.]